ncbi:DUF3052 family protein [Kitasatospora sp. McL0602]|uniref:DUF3052 family protein n=1 Tax=Kitasatospora sp. McL0602 TaxID=3439530 RepID=UPI003F88CAE1
MDEGLREAVAELTGNHLAGGDCSDDLVGAVVLWWRDSGGDLVSVLVGAFESLAGSGVF